ncbi:hypothetical protein [Chamaesiphon polymorphus]|uniref:hypothetical protein n=1 Tax=Chamaesiphon polymorphus TaxID=2107691 RepID=UPI001C626BE2|nr:hypothetical protein [Chamaesiphon polymorphus]
MKTVFVLQHLHILPCGEENIKLIGTYSSNQTARAAIEQLKVQPGFCHNTHASSIHSLMMSKAARTLPG